MSTMHKFSYLFYQVDSLDLIVSLVYPLMAIRQRESTRARQCRGGIHPTFSHMWCVEVMEGVAAPGRAAPSLTHQQYAKSLGGEILYQHKCDKCLDHNKGLIHTCKHNKNNKKAATKVEGGSVCDTVSCKETDPSICTQLRAIAALNAWNVTTENTRHLR